MNHCHLLVEDDWQQWCKKILTDTNEEFPHQPLPCYWHQEFRKRRRFNRQAENQPYIEWLQAIFNDGDEDREEGSNDDDNDNGDGNELNDDEDKVDRHRDKSDK